MITPRFVPLVCKTLVRTPARSLLTAAGVAIAALLPIPFALATWTAGLTGVAFPKLLAASLLRIPKTWFYLWLILQGWAMGG